MRANVVASSGLLAGSSTPTSNRCSRSDVSGGKDTSVIEFAFSGARFADATARTFGLVGASSVTFDNEGLVMSARVYIDLATYVGQTEPERLPSGATVRAVTITCPAGTNVVESNGTPTEARNRRVAPPYLPHAGLRPSLGLQSSDTPLFLPINEPTSTELGSS
jgi:hypothetical protein